MICMLLCELRGKVLLVEERWACYTSRRYIHYFYEKVRVHAFEEPSLVRRCDRKQSPEGLTVEQPGVAERI